MLNIWDEPIKKVYPKIKMNIYVLPPNLPTYLLNMYVHFTYLPNLTYIPKY